MISGLTVLRLRLMAPHAAVFVSCFGVQALEATIGAGTLIKGLDEGLRTMAEGERGTLRVSPVLVMIHPIIFTRTRRVCIVGMSQDSGRAHDLLRDGGASACAERPRGGCGLWAALQIAAEYAYKSAAGGTQPLLADASAMPANADVCFDVELLCVSKPPSGA
eukprot:COSAG01_NODE_7083_length_3361_cov_1.957388_2_plen_163_part_00